MRNGVLRNATLLLFAVGLPALADGHAECAAQIAAGLEQANLSLSADIEEVLRSPFHARAASKAVEQYLSEAGSGSSRYHQHASGWPERASLHGAAVGFTFILAGASHLVGAYLLRKCGLGYTEYGCVLGPALTVPAVALPAVLNGVPPGTALVASTLGLAGGAGAFVMAMTVTRHHVASAVLSGLVHAAIATAAIRRL